MEWSIYGRIGGIGCPIVLSLGVVLSVDLVVTMVIQILHLMQLYRAPLDFDSHNHWLYAQLHTTNILDFSPYILFFQTVDILGVSILSISLSINTWLHEYAHVITAKKYHVKVHNEFQTLYSPSSVLLMFFGAGGSVYLNRIQFNSLPLFSRLEILAAGVGVNILLMCMACIIAHYLNTNALWVDILRRVSLQCAFFNSVPLWFDNDGLKALGQVVGLLERDTISGFLTAVLLIVCISANLNTEG